MKFFINILLILCLCSCSKAVTNDVEFTAYVNPFIGTGGHGHTFPGAVVPLGMVQLSPDTRTQGWDACSGYYYDDNSILGFSHRHLSGTGMTDFADILFTPFVGDLQLEDDKLKEYYPLTFAHENEEASPGFYEVSFDNNIKVSLTATERAGFHKYIFPITNSGLIIDLFHNLNNQKVLESSIRIVDDRTIEGMRLTEGWSKKDYIYFTAQFDKPFSYTLYKEGKAIGDIELNGEHVKAVLKFEDAAIMSKVGISPVDIEGARNNLDNEIAAWNFDEIKNRANVAWNKKLSAIEVKGGTEDEKEIFYTGLYHVYIHPSLYSDVDGRYRGQDLKIHQLDSGQKYYTIFSLWDTYRAQMPLLSILEPNLTNDFVNSLLLKYTQGGLLPMWDIAGCYSGTMIGAHATSVISDLYTKGIRGYDVELAYEAMMRSVPYDTTGVIVHHPAIWEWLMTKGKQYNEELGFIPADKDVIFSTSRGLEYAYCDWALAQVAKDMKKEEDYKYLMERGERYTKYYDSKTGFMRALDSNGNFMEPFNPSLSDHMNSPYCEGNAWQWTWFVPHNPQGLMKLMGGEQEFENKLDTLFNTTAKVEGQDASLDISGLIGQYAHGNEPSHHIIYFYNYINKGYKTQELADKILKEQYSTLPDGLSGNEDCGQMSAWYIMSALGFYQVAPANPIYTISRPIFDEAIITLENGKVLTIKANNNSRDNKYVQSVSLDGEKLDTPFFTHQNIADGGVLEFNMSNTYLNEIKE